MSSYNFTTDYDIAEDFINKNEIDWNSVEKKIYCFSERDEAFVNVKDYNPVKVIKEDTDEYYLIDKETKASNTFKHQILSLMLVTREIYEKELSKLDDKPKTKIKR